MIPSTSLKFALLQEVIIPNLVSTLYLPSCANIQNLCLQRDYRSQYFPNTDRHLSKILSVISEEIGVIEESNIYIAQLYQLKGAGLSRMKIMASIIVISRLYYRCVIIEVIILP
jgi:hypothetical protein